MPKPDKAAKPPARRPRRAKLLSGGNPQIAKADGDTPVQAYINAIPDWKREVVRRVDEIITREIPGVRKAMKWNSPFYGSPDPDLGYFLSLHCFTKYVKIAFFKGAHLKPLPPRDSKSPDVRYLDVYEGPWDESQLARWARQASKIPGWVMK